LAWIAISGVDLGEPSMEIWGTLGSNDDEPVKTHPGWLRKSAEIKACES
jgi:hypothetical protein